MDAECKDGKLENQFVQVSQSRISFFSSPTEVCFLNFSQKSMNWKFSKKRKKLN